ncbi:MAG: hypothetical protein II583_07645 [Oscillospiraceae bacterium]|nr:hypothetical protein [Oscillospiraceae bacterium]
MKVRKLTAISLTLALLLTGCTVAPVTPDTIPDAPIISDPNPVAPEPTPEKPVRTYESVSVQLYEKDSYVYIFQVNAEMTEVDGCRYYFEPTVSEVQREEFISAQTALNEKLSAPEGLSFYVLRNYTFRSESENNLAFYEIGGTATWRQALVTVQLLEGDVVNYGWAYARADALARELGWKTDSFDAPEDMDGVFIDDPGMLNLVYPCFIEPYSTKEETAAAKRLALELYAESEDESAFLRRACEYAEKLGVEFAPTEIRFAYEGKGLQMVIYTEFTEERFPAGFSKDTRLQQFGSAAITWLESISLLLEIHEVGLDAMCRARSVMGYSGEERALVRYKENIRGHCSFGNRVNGHPTIEVASCYSLAHEYVHYVHFMVSTTDAYFSKNGNWKSESLAEHFTPYVEYYEMLAIMDIEGTEDERPSYEQYLDWNGYLSVINQKELSPREQLITGSQYYTAKAFLAMYLVDKYGEEAFVEIMLHEENAPELTGKTLDELIDEWSEYILSHAV